MSIDIQNVTKQYAGTKVLNGISLNVPTGQLVALLGPSGCGKTTLLRIIAGLEAPDSGRVLRDGLDLTSQHPGERQIGFVFQHYALFRHLSVLENIAFGLRARPKATRPSEEEIQKKVHFLLDLIQLDWIAKRYPEQLSGGQRQRVALARVLAVEPKVLLLDEPFGALDAKVRMELRHWLRERHADLGVTTIFVTHDQEEAMDVADRIVIIKDGHIEQDGEPDALYSKPDNFFVCDFLGQVNRFPLNGEVFFVRPHEISLLREAQDGTLAATVCAVRTAGQLVQISLDANGTRLLAAIPHSSQEQLNLAKGERVFAKPMVHRLFPDAPQC